ncbi:MAG: V-type ATPase subunit [Candidatus Methanomethyliaceae archaeon]|nr:V-type ATPase subunit [Candidatus Methanomethyliaceae archaeon]MDW7970933.1 V-type ATPase subunit [Nitrososphaerota archaeon]
MSEEYAAVMAAARKSKMITEQQILEFAASKSIEDFLNKIRNFYSVPAEVSISRAEEELVKNFYKEVEEFIKILPKKEKLLKLIAREFEEEKIARELIRLKEKGQEYLEFINKIRGMGFHEEILEIEKIIEYGIPGLVNSIFSKHRILKMIEELKDYKALIPFISLKVDEHNIITMLRGLKNNIRKDLLEGLIVDGGTIDKKRISEAIKAKSFDETISLLNLRYQRDLRDIERDFEKRMRKILLKAYYMGYGGLEAAISYIELKKIEIKNIIRILNSVALNIEPKVAIQEYFI